MGDLNQLPPVRAGKSLPQAALALAKHDRRKMTAQTDVVARVRMSAEEVFHSEQVTEYAEDSPVRKGSELFTKAVLCELDKQVRIDTSDPEHMALVQKGSKGEKLTVQDMQKYKLLSSSDFDSEDSPWLAAPIIVSTNRERHTLLHYRCIWYAKSKNLPVIRWRAHY